MSTLSGKSKEIVTSIPNWAKIITLTHWPKETLVSPYIFPRGLILMH